MRRNASKRRKRRVKQMQTTAEECAKATKASRCDGCDRGARETHDWALDLEPLALPPDLPPVILKVGVGGLVLGEKVVLSWSWTGGRVGVRGESRRWMGSLLSGGGAVL